MDCLAFGRNDNCWIQTLMDVDYLYIVVDIKAINSCWRSLSWQAVFRPHRQWTCPLSNTRRLLALLNYQWSTLKPYPKMLLAAAVAVVTKFTDRVWQRCLLESWDAPIEAYIYIYRSLVRYGGFDAMHIHTVRNNAGLGEGRSCLRGYRILRLSCNYRRHHIRVTS